MFFNIWQTPRPMIFFYLDPLSPLFFNRWAFHPPPPPWIFKWNSPKVDLGLWKAWIQVRNYFCSLCIGESDKEFLWMYAERTLNIQLAVLIVVQNLCRMEWCGADDNFRMCMFMFTLTPLVFLFLFLGLSLTYLCTTCYSCWHQLSWVQHTGQHASDL